MQIVRMCEWNAQLAKMNKFSWREADVCSVGNLGGGERGRRRGRRWAAANLYSFGVKGETLKAVALFRVCRRCRLQKQMQNSSASFCGAVSFSWVCRCRSQRGCVHLFFGSWITILIHSAVPLWTHWLLITGLLFFHFLNKKSEQEKNKTVELCRTMFGLLLKVGLAFHA